MNACEFRIKYRNSSEWTDWQPANPSYPVDLAAINALRELPYAKRLTISFGGGNRFQFREAR